MNEYFAISDFDAIYLIDLCEPLLDVARQRFEAKGWSNVTVLCQDASEFTLPEWSNGTDPKGSVGFITLSYSLSMVSIFPEKKKDSLIMYLQIPNYHSVLDRIEHVLSPQTGLLSVVDFYTSGKQSSLHDKTIGGISKECGWLSRWFWEIWFDFDHVGHLIR